ncbi:MAG TPA: BtpA/SgcQ family protein [Candidatus Kapabacteria bacterium]|nr:BtpA/SgcQ family protein [Candidatus Kapabacteria bacterium]
MSDTHRMLLEGIRFPVIGMVHLKPLPGAYGFSGSLEAVCAAALEDARALVEGGIDALMMENYGDVPFRKAATEPHTTAAMTAIAVELRRITTKPVGINVLRNDPRAALGIAAAVGARMIRVNVHTGAMLTDQGVIEGDAHDTLAYRRMLGTDALILADVHVKHAAPLAPIPIEVAAADAVERGCADALIVTGSRTGSGANIDEIARVRSAVSAPVLVGSGVTADTIGSLRGLCDGVIVGSWLKVDGNAHAAVDRERVERIMTAAREG